MSNLIPNLYQPPALAPLAPAVAVSAPAAPVAPVTQAAPAKQQRYHPYAHPAHPIPAGNGNGNGATPTPAPTPVATAQSQPATTTTAPTTRIRAGILSDYHNRLRHLPNGLLCPLATSDNPNNHNANHSDNDDSSLFDSDDDSEPEVIQPTRSSSRRTLASSRSAPAPLSSSSAPVSAATPGSYTSSFPSTTAAATPTPAPAKPDDPLAPLVAHADALSRSLLTLPSTTPTAAAPLAPKRVFTKTNYTYLYATLASAQRKSRLAHTRDLLLPIKLDLDIEPNLKLRDTFLWNVREPLVSPEKYADILCTDLGLPSKYVTAVALAIRAQVDEFTDAGGVGAGEWLADMHESESAAHVQELVTVDVDFILGRTHVKDRVEWDVANTLGCTPEQFAGATVAELGLPPEFVSPYACAIREALLKYARDRVMNASAELLGLAPSSTAGAGLAGGGARVPGNARDVRAAGAPPVRIGYEPHWTPALTYIESQAAADRLAARLMAVASAADDRESRRARRETGRGGSAALAGVGGPGAHKANARAGEVARSIKQMREYEEAVVAQAALVKVAYGPTGWMQAAAGAAGGKLGGGYFAGGKAAWDPATQAAAMAAAFAHLPAMDLPKPSAAASAGAHSPASTSIPRAPKHDRLSSTSSGGGRIMEPIAANSLPAQLTAKEARHLSSVDQWIGWHCRHCYIDATRTLSIRKGPAGPRSLCNACGIRYSSDGNLPIQRKDRFKMLYEETKDL